MSFLSVVVATYNRASTIQTTLKKLCEQTLDHGRYEVIIVDDGSTDDTPEVVRRFAVPNGLSFRYLRQPNQGPGAAENWGIREAAGPWILLIADDIHPEPRMLEEHFQAHLDTPEEHVAVAGKVLQSPDLPDTVFLRHWDPFRYGFHELDQQLSYIDFWACNVSFKKSFMERYGMFLERRAAAHEDVEVGWRLFRDGGMKLLYRKEALAYHFHIDTIDTACARSYERGVNFDVMAERVPDPAMWVRYHVVNGHTLKFLFSRETGYARILAPDQNPVKYVFHYAMRRVLYNRFTVQVMILPLLRAAEHRRWLRPLARPRLIGGAVTHYFHRGVAEYLRRSASTVPLAG